MPKPSSAQSAKNAEKLVDLVRQLQAGGGTALYAGVNQGAAEVRKNLDGEYFNRIILLSDGLANEGPSSPADLIRLGRALVKEDISVSTVGLGAGYNEDLMTGLAKEGQGNLYFAETSKELPGIFDAEIGDALSVVARHATLRIELEGGVRPIRLIGRQGSIPKIRWRSRSISSTAGRKSSPSSKWKCLQAKPRRKRTWPGSSPSSKPRKMERSYPAKRA